MTHPTLTPTLFKNGIWRAYVRAETEPQIDVHYLGQVLEDVRIAEVENGWELSVQVPPSAISDGVHCFVIRDSPSTEKLGEFTIIAGTPAAEDLRAEVALLRAELDMLKRSFRRSQASSD
ncbi:hypothetical protein [Ruegeria arenilitoris]|uniref:hypothetical protein n=1 Tax=Ruegeria arenilitoris TaxID=1173585 RepID=UPI00147F3B66|nr:hypothetical protein [Ruegeria arenilitoris]